MKKNSRWIVGWCVLAAVTVSCGLSDRLLDPASWRSENAGSTVQVVLTPGQAATTPLVPSTTTTIPVPSPTPFIARITTRTIQRETQEPPSIVDIEYPFLEEDAGIITGPFNAAVAQMVTEELQAYEETINVPPPPEVETGPNSLYLRYEVRNGGSRFLSVFYNHSTYSAGAAHPLPWSSTMNYDMQQGVMIHLDDLFQPGVDYLQVLSDECVADLERQGTLEWNDGAAPAPENYSSWILLPEGLQITFDPYQVASYAAGFQTVLIPWERLIDILSPEALEQLDLQ